MGVWTYQILYVRAFNSFLLAFHSPPYIVGHNRQVGKNQKAFSNTKSTCLLRPTIHAFFGALRSSRRAPRKRYQMFALRPRTPPCFLITIVQPALLLPFRLSPNLAVYCGIEALLQRHCPAKRSFAACFLTNDALLGFFMNDALLRPRA